MTTTLLTTANMNAKFDIFRVARLDDAGLDCAYCSTMGVTVEAQINYTIEEPHEDVFETGCANCMVERINEAALLGAYDITMEIS